MGPRKGQVPQPQDNVGIRCKVQDLDLTIFQVVDNVPAFKTLTNAEHALLATTIFWRPTPETNCSWKQVAYLDPNSTSNSDPNLKQEVKGSRVYVLLGSTHSTLAVHMMEMQKTHMRCEEGVCFHARLPCKPASEQKPAFEQMSREAKAPWTLRGDFTVTIEGRTYLPHLSSCVHSWQPQYTHTHTRAHTHISESRPQDSSTLTKPQ